MLESLIEVCLIEERAKRLIREVLDNYFKEIKLMSTIQEDIDAVTAIGDKLTTISTKLDAIADLVAGLKGGQVATQAQVDALGTALASVQAIAEGASSKEDTITA